MQKAVWKSKTVWANVIAIIIMVLGYITSVITVQNMTYFTISLSVLNLVLRYLTDQPIGLKDVKPVIDAAEKLKLEHTR